VFLTAADISEGAGGIEVLSGGRGCEVLAERQNKLSIIENVRRVFMYARTFGEEEAWIVSDLERKRGFNPSAGRPSPPLDGPPL